MRVRLKGVMLLFLGLSCLPAFSRDVSLAVFSFENHSGDPELYWLGEALAESLSRQLQVPGLSVVHRDERLGANDRLGLPSSGNFSRATTIKIARDLAVDYLLLGAFDRTSGKVRLSAELLDLNAPRIEKLAAVEGTYEDLSRVENELARQVLARLSISHPPGLLNARARTISNSALEHYIKSLLSKTREMQIWYLIQALKEHPQFPQAAFLLGKLYILQQDYKTASLWLVKVAAAEEDYLEAQFLLGNAYYHLQDLPRSVRAFAEVQRWTAFPALLNNLGATYIRQKDYGRAVEPLQQVLQWDANHPEALFNLCYVQYLRKEFQAAAESARRLVKIKQDPAAQYVLARSLAALGENDEAEKQLQAARESSDQVQVWEDRGLPDLGRISGDYDPVELRKTARRRQPSN